MVPLAHFQTIMGLLRSVFYLLCCFGEHFGGILAHICPFWARNILDILGAFWEHVEAFWILLAKITQDVC